MKENLNLTLMEHDYDLCSCMMLQFVCYFGLIVHCFFGLTEVR